MKLPFDKCYCLHIVESSERYDNIKTQLNKLGIEDQVEIWWTTKRPLSTKIGEMITTLHTEAYDKIRDGWNKDLYGAVYNVSLEFYTMIKQAYLRGFETILFMEDDIQFIDGYDYEYLFSHLPNDWDIIRFGFMAHHDEKLRNHKLYNECNDLLLKIDDICFGGMQLVAFNRKAMKFYINYMDEKFEYADAPLTFYFLEENKRFIPDNQKLNVYFARQSVVNANDMISIINSDILYKDEI